MNTGKVCRQCHHKLDLHGTPVHGKCQAYYGDGRYCQCDLTYDPARTRKHYAGHNWPHATTTRSSTSGETLFEGRYPRHKGAE